MGTAASLGPKGSVRPPVCRTIPATKRSPSASRRWAETPEVAGRGAGRSFDFDPDYPPVAGGGDHIVLGPGLVTEVGQFWSGLGPTRPFGYLCRDEGLEDRTSARLIRAAGPERRRIHAHEVGGWPRVADRPFPRW
jgi:hypothetical protein